MKKISCFFVAASLLIASSDPSFSQSKKTVAVLEFVSADLPKNDVTNLGNRFRALLSQTQVFDLLEREKMNEILKAQDFNMSDNCNTSECAVQVGQLLGVEYMVAGDIGKVGQVYTIDLRMIDILTGKIVQSKSEDYKGEIEGLLEVMKMIANSFAGIKSDDTRLKVKELSSTHETFGTAIFKLSVEGATPVINGVAGNPVFSKDIKLYLSAGVHRIKFTKSGFAITQEFNIMIKENQEVTQSVEMKEDKTAVVNTDLSLNFGVVSISSIPAGAKIIDGEVEVGTTPASGLKLSIGTHTLTLKKSKYHDQSFTADIKDGLNRIPEKTLEANFGTLKISSSPAGAKIKINGILKQGTTPQVFDEFQSGKYEIEVEKDRYFSERKSLEVRDQQVSDLIFILKPQFGDVTITSNPSGAKVYLDKELIGTTPLTKKGETDGILAGTYSLRLTMNSDLYRDYEDAITVKAGEPLQKTIDLKTNFGTIKVITDKTDIKMFVNGTEHKEFGKDMQIRLQPGTYEIELIKDKHYPIKKTISLSEGALESIQAQFTAKQGRIIAYSVPDGAEFTLVDETGKEIYKGKTLDQQVFIGTYTVKAQMEGYGLVKEKTVIVTEGYKEPIEVTFTDEDKRPSLTITTNPGGADITLDGQAIGQSPLTVDRVSVGEHKLKAELKRNGKQFVGQSKISLTMGENKKVEILLEEAEVLEIGQSYQGGIIAYILRSGDPGYIVGQSHGLIAAPSDHSHVMQWYNGSYNYTQTGATGTAIGTGNANTNTIVASQGEGGYAAKLCYDLVLGGYTDWYLPSKDELNKLYLNRAAIGGFDYNYYWSSSGSNSARGSSGSNFAWGQHFPSGLQNTSPQTERYLIRAVRAF